MRGFVALAFMALALACGREAAPSQPAVAAAPAISVASVAVARESVPEVVLGTGSIVADKATEIGPRVSGIIEAVHVDVGATVVAGDPLFTTRRVDYRLRLAEAEQALRLAQAEAENSRRRLERVEQLFAQQVASQGHLDDARTAYEMAAARAGGAESAHAMARQALADTVVRAPYPGVITRRYVDEGTMLSAQMTSAPVVQLMKTDRVEAVVQIPELHLARVRQGTPARVRVDGVDATFETSVAVVNDRVDAASRAFEVRLPIENADLALKPGLFARAEILPEPRDALVIPRAALQGSAEERFVFVASADRALRRAVETRELDATRVEVVAGLREGDLVLYGPNAPKLSDGASIAPEVARANR
jgi:RND family efflux transporter MFP subunit